MLGVGPGRDRKCISFKIHLRAFLGRERVQHVARCLRGARRCAGRGGRAESWCPPCSGPWPGGGAAPHPDRHRTTHGGFPTPGTCLEYSTCSGSVRGGMSERSRSSVVAKTVTCRDGRHGMPEEAEGPRACRRKQGRPHGRQHVQVGVLPGRCGERRGQSGRSRVVLATLFVTCSPSLPPSSSLTEHRCRRGRRSHSRLPGLPPGCGQPCVQEPPVKVLGLKKAFALITTVKEKGGAVTE